MERKSGYERYKEIRGVIRKTMAVVAVVVLAVYLYPLATMRPAKTGVVPGTDVTALRSGINTAYVIEAEDGYILVDAGSSEKKIEKSLTDLGISPESVRHVLLTHSDSDHVAALGLFKNADIYMSEMELPMIDGSLKRSGDKYNKLPQGTDESKLVLLKDGENILIAPYPIRCIHAAGHTPGSMAYLFGDKYLFTGDAARASGKGKELKVHPLSMDADIAKWYINELEEVIEDYEPVVFTSHYGYSDFDENK